MSDMEINGVKFSEKEIKSVTIERGGRNIVLEKPRDEVRIGFEPPATDDAK